MRFTERKIRSALPGKMKNPPARLGSRLSRNENSTAKSRSKKTTRWPNRCEDSAPVSLLRVLSRSEDEATRKNVILNPFTPYDVLSELENQFTELFVNNPALESYNSMKL